MSLATEQAFVTELYENVLFHSAADIASTATQASITSWATMISDGQITESQATTDFADSAEASQNVLPIISLYEGLLKRAPESGAIAFYVAALNNGTSLNTIAQYFINSPEFAALYGAHPTPTNFVTDLYHNVLGRTPDQADLAFYVNILGGAAATPSIAAMAGVVLDFTRSFEALSDSTLNSENWLIAGAGGTPPATIVAGPVTYTLTNGGTSSATEGSTVSFHLATLNVAAGTVVSYTLSGVTAAEVVGGALAGTVAVGANGTATIPVTLVNDAGEGLSGSLTATLLAPANAASVSVTTASVVLNETAPTAGTPFYSLTETILGGGTSATEGTTVAFHVSASNVPAGTILSYTLSGVTAGQVANGLLTGLTTVSSNGTAIIPITLSNAPGAGLTGGLTMTLAVPAGAQASSITTATAPLTETSAPAAAPLYTLSEAVNGGATTATEGSVVIFHLDTSNVVAGTALPYTLSGVTASEVVGNQLTGTATVGANGSTNISVTLNSATGEGLTGPLAATLTVPAGASASSVTTASVALLETAGNTLDVPGAGGASITLSTAVTGGVTVGNAAGLNEPSGAITIADTAATGAVTIYGGAGVTATSFSTGGIIIGGGTLASDPTGAITVTDNAASGAVQTFGGVGVTVSTASTGGVTVGTIGGTAEPTGAVTITDTAAAGLLTVYGGAAVVITSSSNSPITIGAAATIAADPVGNITITNLITDPVTQLVTFGTAPAAIVANGGNTVTLTGTSGDSITDASVTGLLANITLDGVGGATAIHTANALISLTVLDGGASSSQTITEGVAHTLALAVGSTTVTPAFANVTDATATSVTVTASGTTAETLTLSVANATTIILGAHTGTDLVQVGTILAAAVTAGTVITGAVTGDSIRFADTATSVVTLGAVAGTLASAIATVDAAATTIAHSATIFQSGGNSYILESVGTGNGTLQAGDSLIELVGTHTISSPVAGILHLLS